ncbi:MAG: helix-turn-helix domain-containing protein [Lachnospiraceae bacterium]|nr:helix-turn-helix domain-containing protein [Lachnospiraceae bacterium]
MSEKTTLGRFIAQQRKILRLTQEELAERICVSKSAVAKWETDGGLPDRDNLKRIAQILGVSVDDLHRIIEQEDVPQNDTCVNITSEVIAALESYGYKVIPPSEQKEEEGKK